MLHVICSTLLLLLLLTFSSAFYIFGTLPLRSLLTLVTKLKYSVHLCSRPSVHVPLVLDRYTMHDHQSPSSLVKYYKFKNSWKSFLISNETSQAHLRSKMLSLSRLEQENSSYPIWKHCHRNAMLGRCYYYDQALHSDGNAWPWCTICHPAKF